MCEKHLDARFYRLCNYSSYIVLTFSTLLHNIYFFLQKDKSALDYAKKHRTFLLQAEEKGFHSFFIEIS